jgi:membrane protein implicated in regulation of membrane protease activity
MNKKQNWSLRIVLRYALLQLPEIAVLILILTTLWMLLNMPLWSVWIIVVLWIAKDIIMFPFVWRAYDQGNCGSLGSLLGLKGRVTERLSPAGYIKVRGELWRAEIANGSCLINEGEIVEVCGSNGSKLIVQPEAIEEK